MQAQRNAAPKMERTGTPGIYKRGSRYVVVWRHRGKRRSAMASQNAGPPGRGCVVPKGT